MAGKVFMVQRKVHNITSFSGMRCFFIKAPLVCVCVWVHLKC